MMTKILEMMVLLPVAGFALPILIDSAALAMARKSRLEGRLTSILDQRTNRRTISRRVALCVVSAFALLALPVAMMRAAVADEGLDSPQKSIEEMVADWVDQTISNEEPELLYQAQSEDGDPVEDWFLEKESLLDPTKKRWRLKVTDPVREGGMAPIGVVADHYLEKYAAHAAMRAFAERRSKQHDEGRELEKSHAPKHRAVLASDYALSEIERQIVRLGRQLDRGAVGDELNRQFDEFTARSRDKQREKRELLDMGLAESHPKIRGIQAEIELLNQAPLEFAGQFIDGGFIADAVRRMDSAGPEPDTTLPGDNPTPIKPK